MDTPCKTLALARDFAWRVLFQCLLPCAICSALVFAAIPFDKTNRAYAAAPVVAGASAFVSECAAACGLSAGDFVATIVGSVAVSSGMVLANDTGVSFGASSADNLSNLVDAADYPDFDTLSAEDQTAWGTRGDYEAAKFNSLMDAFGLEQARDRYYSSGGGNFEWQQDEIEKLNQLGSIGNRWAYGIANTFDDIRDSVVNRNSVYSFAGVTPEVSTEETGLTLPSGLYGSISGTVGNSCALRFSGDKWFGSSTKDVIWVYVTTGTNSYSVRAYSTEPFAFGFNRGSYPSWDYSNNMATAYTVGDSAVYSAGLNFSRPGTYESADISKVGDLSRGMDDVQDSNLGYLLLYGRYTVETTVPDYPNEEIPDTTPVYVPQTITEQTPWNVYITQPETPPAPVERPDTPYNPDNETGGQPWRDDTEKNVLPLMNIHFDKLFPFSLLYDLPKMTEKVASLTTEQTGSGEYSRIAVPIVAGDLQESEMVLDLQPVHDLLVMTRPFFLILLIVGMVMSLVLFWRAILTGD